MNAVLGRYVMSFTHFLLTRFNLSRPDFELDDGWYRQRFDLFERFCLPSVKAQTNQRFRWLLFADRSTPDAYRSRIESYQSYANLQVQWLDGVDRVQMAHIVRAQLDDSVTHLISSTLDNDDALARDFVAQVQGQFAAQDFELFNFLHGLRYDLLTRKLYVCDLPSNPFISLIEQIGVNKQIRSIAGCLPHSTMKQRFGQIHNVSTAALWLQVIHGRNVASTGAVGRSRVPVKQLDELFDLDYDAPQETDGELAFRVQNARAHLERRLINSLSGEQQLRIRQLLQKVRR